MTVSEALLDTDTLSGIMRQNPLAVSQARTYLQTYGHFTLSIITRYEILRGLKAKNALIQQSAFNHFCAANRVLPLEGDVVVQAADVYTDLQQRGQLIGDADILIAATAVVHGLTLITNNENHFRRITGLQVDNWLT